MQKVACPMMIVRSEKFVPPQVKKELSAMPVMMAGSAIGSTSTSDTAPRPKKRKRYTANATIEPSSSAMQVAISAARIESQNASLMSWLWNVEANHLVDSPSSGQL